MSSSYFRVMRSFGIGAAFCTIAVSASAQDNAPAPAPGPSAQVAPAGSEAAKDDEARQRYKRGLELFSENNFEAARVELERAYQLNPSYRILYNIGLCYEQLGDYVEAMTTLQRYLDRGGDGIPADRRKEVETEVLHIQPRIATAKIKINVDAAELLVDDQCGFDKRTKAALCMAGGSNYRELLLNPGRRRITVKKAGYLPETQTVSVAGSDEVELSIDLKPLPRNTVRESNPWVVPTVIGWSVAGAGAVAAIITGVVAKNDATDQADAVGRLGTTRSHIDDLRNKTQTMANVTDAIWIGSGVVAAASAYFTFRALKWKSGATTTKVEVGAGSLLLEGEF